MRCFLLLVALALMLVTFDGAAVPAYADVGGIGATPSLDVKKRRAALKAKRAAAKATEGETEQPAGGGKKHAEDAASDKKTDAPLLIDNTPGDSPEAAENATKDEKKGGDAPAPVPLLVINFDSRHTYFDRQLEKVIKTTEKAKAGANYKIVSLLPAGGTSNTKKERLTEEYGGNLQRVLDKFSEMGIHSSRVETVSQTSDTVKTHTISIYGQ